MPLVSIFETQSQNLWDTLCIILHNWKGCLTACSVIPAKELLFLFIAGIYTQKSIPATWVFRLIFFSYSVVLTMVFRLPLLFFQSKSGCLPANLSNFKKHLREKNFARKMRKIPKIPRHFPQICFPGGVWLGWNFFSFFLLPTKKKVKLSSGIKNLRPSYFLPMFTELRRH